MFNLGPEFDLDALKKKEFLNTREAAELLNVSSTTLKGLTYEGKIPYTRRDGMIRYKSADIFNYLASRNP